MSTSLFLDKVLSVYLSEGMMIFTVVLLIVAIIAFIKGKGRRALRTGCIVVGIYCIIYLGAVLVLSSLFGSNHKPSPPVPAKITNTTTNLDSIHELEHILTFAEQKGPDYAADQLLYLDTYSYIKDDLHQKWGVPDESGADSHEDIWVLSDEYQLVIKYDADEEVEKITVQSVS